LRLALAGALAFDASGLAGADSQISSWTIRLALVACAVAIALGYMTRVVLTALVALGTVALARYGSVLWTASVSTASVEAVLLKIAIAASVAISGPGAYSADARLFGRREINIPPPSGLRD
jgi:uncharacterized membrane protein YphA (DoxX/SURF4 family)